MSRGDFSKRKVRLLRKLKRQLSLKKRQLARLEKRRANTRR